jgi:hypothetical protein
MDEWNLRATPLHTKLSVLLALHGHCVKLCETVCSADKDIQPTCAVHIRLSQSSSCLVTDATLRATVNTCTQNNRAVRT